MAMCQAICRQADTSADGEESGGSDGTDTQQICIRWAADTAATEFCPVDDATGGQI